ncbi:MAG TPA: gliding motility-associated C-terminal domain-containing protein, partial [Prolixibacteraceae bacterium]|nr:gliding motility-associated C-terminal domain-containing protein [Prolixibacteraceae bacterium]
QAYSVVLKDAQGCETPIFAVPRIEEPAEINVTLSLTQALSCPGGNSGILTATTSGGGSGGYRYTLKRETVDVPGYVDVTGGAIRDFTDLTEGIYEVEVHTSGCTDHRTDQATIASIPDVTIDITYTPVLCRDEIIDDFNVKATGGDGGVFTYTLKETNGTPHLDSPKTEANSGTGVTFNNVLPGKTYRVEASYGTCGIVAIKEDITINNPSTFTVYYPASVQLKCYGGDTTITVSASGQTNYAISTDGINYTGFSNGDKHVLSNLTEGTYAYYFRDGNGCDYNNGMPISIDVIPANQINVNVLTPNPRVKCFDESNGKVELQITGGTASFSVEVIGSGRPSKTTDASGLVTFVNLPAGDDYDVHVIDAGGCDVTRSAVFSVQNAPGPLVVSTVYDPLLKCYGDSTQVQVNFTGGWPSSNYLVNVTGGDGINEYLFPPSYSKFLKKGTYYIAVTDNDNGCVAKDTITIKQPNKLSFNYHTHSNVSCFGENDASISFTLVGGTTPYFWGVNDVPTTQMSGTSMIIDNTIMTLSADEYSLFVADDNGCIIPSKNIKITEPAPITFEVDNNGDSVSCFGGNDGRIRIKNVDGGSGQGYRSYISTGGGAETQKTLIITGLVKNTYTVVVSDNSGTCRSESVDVKIEQPDEIIISSVDKEDIKCYNVNEGTIKINAQGGGPYDLEYRITKEPNYDSGYSLSNEFSSLPYGVYTAWVRNTKGKCAQQYVDKITIDNADELIVNKPIVTNVKCHNEHNGEVKIEATGGTGILTYNLTSTAPITTNSTGVFTGLGEDNKAVTTYNYLVEDINGCPKTGSFQVRNPEQIKLEVAGRTEIQCNDDVNGTLTLLVTGGTVGTKSSYSISDYDNPSIAYQTEKINDSRFVLSKLGNKALVATYNPIATDDNGCTTVPLAAVVDFINPAKVVIDSVALGEKLCHGDVDDKTIIHATGGTGKFYYSLDNGATLSALEESVFVGEKAGTKRPYVKDENGCEATFAAYEYLEPLALEVEYTFFPIQCFDDEFGNVVLDIKGGTGNYEVNYNSPNFDSNVHEIPRSQLDVTTFDFHKNDINLTDDITYYFYLRDANNCHVQNVEGVNNYTKPFADTVFTKPQKLVLEKLDQRMVTCRNENTGVILFEASGGTISATNGYTLTTTNVERGQVRTNVLGSYQVDKLFAGLHRCVLTDANGCIGETRMSPVYDFDTITVAYKNESIFLEIAEIIQPHCNETYEGVLKINVADYTQDGVVAKVDYYNGALDVFYIFDRDDTIKAEIDYATGLDTDNPLYFANSKTVAENMGVGRYVVYVEDIYTGCSASIDTTIISKFGDDCREINYYNVFTPHNGDDLHENWTIRGSQHQKYALQIYTPYGEMVYSREGTADGEGVKWNGVDNKDRPVPVGTYIYLLNKYKGSKRDTFINGNITILRGDGRR